MKRFFLSLIVVGAIGAQAQTFDWLTTLSASETSKAQTNIQYAAYYPDSSVLIFGNYGSLAATDQGVLGDKRYNGAEYGTASGYNKNMLLAKIDKHGAVVWAVHSEDGDVNDSQSAVTATADGGAVMALKFRHSDHNKQNGVAAPLYKLIDSEGTAYSREMVYPGAWVNQPVLVRVDKDGKVTKVQDMWCSWEQAAQGTGLTTDAFSFTAAAEDEDGHLFISGSQSLDLSLGSDTLHARPQPDWDGTTTNGRYNGFVLKLDADLHYIAHIAGEGTVQTDKPACVAIKGDKLYFSGLAKAEETGSLRWGEQQTEIKELSVVNVCINTDLQVAWLTATPMVRYNNKQGNNLYQSVLSQDGQTLYLTGGMQGAVVLNGDTVHSGGEALSTMNDGYTYAYSTSDGSMTHAVVFGNTTLNLNHGAVEYGDSLYVYNYAFGSIRQVAYTLDLQRGETKTLATGGGSSTLVYAAGLNGQVLLALRSKGGTDFNVMDSTVNIAGLWFNTLVAYHLPEIPTQGLERLPLSSNGVQKILRNGQILIIRNKQTYSIIGQKQ